jgi:drug/metabolite transporter (DMT)-like permease
MANSAIVVPVELLIGQLLALGTAFCWAQNSLIYTYVGRQVSSSATAHVRLWIAFPLILLVHLLFEGTLWPIITQWQPLLLLGFSGLMGFFVADLFIFAGFVALGARQTMVVMTTSPIVGALLAWIFQDERLVFLQIVGISLTLLGVVWVVFADGLGTKSKEGKAYRWGLLAALGGSITQALAMVLAKAGMTAYGVTPLSATVIRIAAGLVGIAVFALMRGRFLQDFARFKGRPGRKALVLVALAAIVGPVLGIIMNLTALNLAPVGVVTTLSQTTPVILLPLEVYLMKRPISRTAVLGTITAIAGTTLLFLPS